MSDIEAPLRIEADNAIEWDDAADVIVVGFGGAGACAAIEARERGADVLAIDRFDGGGSTALSGGVCYAGATKFQRAAGIDDSVEEMYEYLRLEAGDVVSDATLRRFCADSSANLEWLEQHGVPFGASLYTGKVAMPPAGKNLYYSGNEKVPRYAERAKPAPRGHRTVGKGLWTGYVLFGKMRAAAHQAGVRFMNHAPVTRLVVDQTGQVFGVEVMVIPTASIALHRQLCKKVAPLSPFNSATAEQAIEECNRLEAGCRLRRLIRARRGVVLATGSFEYNVPMLERYLPSSAVHHLALIRSGGMGSYGSGIRLGQSVGGTTGKMDSKLIACMNSPPEEQLFGIIVNREGRRFINEDTYAGFLGNAINAQPESKAWLVLDSATFWKIVRGALPSGDGQFMTLKAPVLMNIAFGETRRANSLRELARKCRIDPDSLEHEVSVFNAAARNGGADPQGKSSAYLRAMGNGPYYAINKATSNKFCFSMFSTLGGLRLDEETGAVLRPDGSAIAGLYAAGRTAVGVCSQTYVSGLSLADLVFSGRRAGRALVACE